MQLTPWILSWVAGTALIASTGSVLAEPDTHTDSAQHQALDDAALEEKYGIKAGAVQRDEASTDRAVADDTESSPDDDDRDPTEGGTGGTGSAEDAIENGEDEQSNDDDQ